MVDYILNKIKDIFTERDIKYYCEEKIGRIGVNFQSCLIMFHVEPDCVHFKRKFKGDVPKERQTEVMVYLNYINGMFQEGHMEMDDDGGVSYRISTDISEEQDISEYRLLRMMRKGMDAQETFHRQLRRVADGTVSGEEAYIEVESRMQTKWV